MSKNNLNWICNCDRKQMKGMEMTCVICANNYTILCTNPLSPKFNAERDGYCTLRCYKMRAFQ